MPRRADRDRRRHRDRQDRPRIALARRLGGEIVNADSRQVYRGMDIGTAKPTPRRARRRSPLTSSTSSTPTTPFTLAPSWTPPNAALDDVWSRGSATHRRRRHGPVRLGAPRRLARAARPARSRAARRAGSDRPPARRRRMRSLRELRAIDPASAAAIDARNTRRVIRAIEVTRATGRPFSEWQRKGDARILRDDHRPRA